ncbi:putative 3-hydroxybenzoate 6-hydroxylase [Rhizodiscina lignyota]|uniref:3-hydroxybenzoate 6-hydroxylase n=1 Tax=Rhizodiscina lignyota TaxID=1504668 RepID=A0A9P4IA64_9PEZI|nr:putative 3-hydroxybenzoate 6-hydroxylase [Rhizodiscina lignyota]
MPVRPLKVAIVGGGPGGLATSIALSKVPNVDVVIYEKAKILREVGAGIRRFTSVRIQRTKLQSTLLSHVKPGVLQLSKRLERIEDLGQHGVQLFFADGTTDIADLVIGADGIRSQYLPEIQTALKEIETGAWREFAAFSGPELSDLTAWGKIALVGDSSHALSGAFGSGAGFAMEDGWILAQALSYFRNDLVKALRLFNEIRLPYYRRMYAHLESEAKLRAARLEALELPSEEDRVRVKVIRGGKDMAWIYSNDIGNVWKETIEQSGSVQENGSHSLELH